jgi:16S rRNA (guanine527-N7)-methyltransferase
MGEKSRMYDTNLLHTLNSGLSQLQLDEQHSEKLLQFTYLLEKWNKTYNITAIRSLEKMVVLHILDSASVYRYLTGNSIIDVGTGGGIPGIILAILNSKLKVTLLDTSQKKTRFLRFAVRELKLENVTVVCERVEKYQAIPTYDVVISRAFSEVGDFIRSSGHLCADSGFIYAMKGPRVESERNVSDYGFQLKQEIDIEVPYLDAKRRLLIFNKI